MVVQLVCSNEEAKKADGVVNLIAAHRRAVSMVERLGRRLMEADEAEAILLGRRLDAVMADEAVVRRQAAMAPVADLGELKIKAAYFKRLMNQGWCDLGPDDLHELLCSFADVPA